MDSSRHHRKHLALWSAVGGTMALIVVMWLLLLPIQLKEFKMLGAGDVARWRVLRDGKEGPAPTFKETLDRMGEQLRAAERSAIDADRNNTVSKDDILKLRTKIEAASQKNQLGANETKR